MLVRTIQRQSGNYRDAVALLAMGNGYEALELLHNEGWIKEIEDDAERWKTMATDFANNVTSGVDVLAIAPTHREGDLLTKEIRTELRERQVLSAEERSFAQLTPLRFTEAEKQDMGRLKEADVAVFHSRGKGFRKGEEVDLSQAIPEKLPSNAKDFEVYKRGEIAIAEGERIRITHNGKTKDGAHRLNNGDAFTVKGFSNEGDIILNNDWVVAKDYTFLAPGYVSTSHAAQGKTVDRVLIAESAMSFPAAGREQFYVTVSRGRHNATIYTNDRHQLAEAISKHDPRMSATELLNRDSQRRKIKKVQRSKQREHINKDFQKQRGRDMEMSHG